MNVSDAEGGTAIMTALHRSGASDTHCAIRDELRGAFGAPGVLISLEEFIPEQYGRRHLGTKMPGRVVLRHWSHGVSICSARLTSVPRGCDDARHVVVKRFENAVLCATPMLMRFGDRSMKNR